MPRKSNGEGSISFETARNKWRAAITDPKGERIVKRFNTRKEAQEWIAVIKSEIYRNVYVPPSNITVGEWIMVFLETYKAAKIRPKTMDRYIQTAKHLAPIASIPLQQLTAHAVQQLYNTLPEMSPSSKNKVHKLLKAAVTKAHATEVISKNVMLAVDAPSVPKVDVQVFTKEEINTILQTVRSSEYYNKYYPFILLAVTTGARLGELLGLKISKVHKGYIYIDNSLQYVRGRLVDMPPKTSASVRRITIAPNVEKLLRTLSASDKVCPFDGYVFHTKTGTPYSPRNMERTWKNILKAAKLEHKNFHVLRHTMATQLLANGISIAEVAKRLGHSRISHTLNLYSHAIPDYDSGIPNVLEKLYAL